MLSIGGSRPTMKASELRRRTPGHFGGIAVDSQDLVTVYTVSNPVEAEIIKNALQAEGIKCFVEGTMQAAGSGLAGIPVTIQVPATEADHARKFLKEHEHRRKHGH
jgi:hypothetical protein